MIRLRGTVNPCGGMLTGTNDSRSTGYDGNRREGCLSLTDQSGPTLRDSVISVLN